jgi:hypothetical protein
VPGIGRLSSFNMHCRAIAGGTAIFFSSAEQSTRKI